MSKSARCLGTAGLENTPRGQSPARNDDPLGQDFAVS